MAVEAVGGEIRTTRGGHAATGRWRTSAGERNSQHATITGLPKIEMFIGKNTNSIKCLLTFSPSFSIILGPNSTKDFFLLVTITMTLSNKNVIQYV